jgi:GDPmannose 4,6-dehydratase
MTETALITGVTGQDGSYLSEYLLSKGYNVYGLERWKSTQGRRRIDHISGLELINGDLSDQSSLDRAIRETEPDEVYNLAALSFVPESFNQPIHTGNITGLGATRVLEAVRKHQPGAKFYQASTSELFGNSTEETQSIETPFQARSPYGTSKLYAYWSTVNYREAYDMFAVNGVLFNHESPRRGKNFVTRKITRGAAAISLGLQDKLELGNLDAKRDWGHAEDYIRAMHMMLQQDTPEDLVIGTSEHHSVRECAQIAFDEVDLDWEDYVEINEKFFRPAEVDALKADISKAKSTLGWEPQRSFRDLIEEMVQTDLEELQSESSKMLQSDE